MIKIGQRFKNHEMYEDIPYILAQVDYKKVALISLHPNGANRWTNPVEVVDVYDITHKEWCQITNDEYLDFEKV